MTTAGVSQQVSEVAKSIGRNTVELAVTLAGTIYREVHLYRDVTPVPFKAVVASCAANVAPIFSAIATDDEFDISPAIDVGAARARDVVPLSSVMEAFRVAFRDIWDAVMVESEQRIEGNGPAMRILTSKVLAAQQAYTDAMAMGYRGEKARQLDRGEPQRVSPLESLLYGRIVEQWSLWEAADYLKLPTNGPYLVVAAEIGDSGTAALPQIESKLRSMDVYSAWHLLPELQVGIVHIKWDRMLPDVVTLISQSATARVGISAPFNDLREAPQALRFARVSLRGQLPAGELVSQFDNSILATAAVSAPDVLVKLVAPELARFSGLSDQEQDTLFDTFQSWVDNDGSVRAAGDALFCHPNTVRYRLHRIEERTGRSLSKPRDVAELCLAFEVQRRLMGR
ncbi:hypothetical protein ABIA30_001376 [Mycobacterium sp. MAA66]|jgi:hypothetical protein|uniref:PucR family transcriptional regulator n=1 Tax=Mycobacterium sp. MAA66 TaxID=3156297 RepID=UPI003514D729